MWYDNLYNNYFIKALYSKTPPRLDGIRVITMEIRDEADQINFSIDLPVFPDLPPKKWIQDQTNVGVVELGFFGIKEFKMELFPSSTSSNFEIVKEGEFIRVTSSGLYTVSFLAEAGRIAKVRAYQDASISS